MTFTISQNFVLNNWSLLKVLGAHKYLPFFFFFFWGFLDCAFHSGVNYFCLQLEIPPLYRQCQPKHIGGGIKDRLVILPFMKPSFEDLKRPSS